MRTKRGFLAALSCSLASLCVMWLVADVMILGRKGWDIGLFWLLLFTALSAVFFEVYLRRERSFSRLTAVTLALALAWLALQFLLTAVKLSFLHILVMTVGAGMAAGMPLYFCVKRPTVHQHLNYLDVSVLAFGLLLLCGPYLGIGRETNLLFVLVLLLEAGAAVGLRMGSGGAQVRKATAVSLASAAVLAAAVTALVSLFSRSGAFVGRILEALAAAGRAAGDTLTRFLRWFTGLLYRPESSDTLSVVPEGPAAALIEGVQQKELVLPDWFVHLCLTAVAAAAVLFAVLLLRSLKRPAPEAPVAEAEPARMSREEGLWARWWKELKRKLRFAWTALRRRNSAAGLLVWLEAKARRQRRSRRKGETMRGFIGRMAPDGILSPLAEALDLEYYGGGGTALTAAQCRAMRRAFRQSRGKGE